MLNRILASKQKLQSSQLNKMQQIDTQGKSNLSLPPPNSEKHVNGLRPTFYSAIYGIKDSFPVNREHSIQSCSELDAEAHIRDSPPDYRKSRIFNAEAHVRN